MPRVVGPKGRPDKENPEPKLIPGKIFKEILYNPQNRPLNALCAYSLQCYAAMLPRHVCYASMLPRHLCYASMPPRHQCYASMLFALFASMLFALPRHLCYASMLSAAENFYEFLGTSLKFNEFYEFLRIP